MSEEENIKEWARVHVAQYVRAYTRTDALSEMTDAVIGEFGLTAWRREEVKEVVKEVVYSTEGIG